MGFELTAATTIYVREAALEELGTFLAERLRPATGFGLSVRVVNDPERAGIHLALIEDSELGAEGYELEVEQDRVTIRAPEEAGLLWGIQTLRQLLPPRIELDTPQRGPWRITTGKIRDYPRFAWRGAMLDVARIFFDAEEVKQFIDVMSYYKLNRLHLHLTDDQGWRIMIESWPNLAIHGGSTQVGGGPGGYYTQDEYRELVRYATRRNVMIVPEIEMPGHVNAALASYSELTCDGVAPPLYTGVAVGFSTFCFDTDFIYEFVADVVAEVAALTPGPYFHIGADESKWVLPEHHYLRFVQKVEGILAEHDKKMIGWEEMAAADITPNSIIQHWNDPEKLEAAVAEGHPVIFSPAIYAYLDSKYDSSTTIGNFWTGEYLDVEKAYSWDPADLTTSEGAVLGVEGTLFTESMRRYEQVEFLAFPRLIGLAEMGWSPGEARSWEEYAPRLGAHGPRLSAMGVNYFPAPKVPWK